MEVYLECGCGNRISGVADGAPASDTSVECDCGAMWAVTVTNIRDGETEP